MLVLMLSSLLNFLEPDSYAYFTRRDNGAQGCETWGQFNKEIQVYFTSWTLVFTNSHQFESTKSSQVPVRSLQLVLTMVFYWIQSVISRKFTCTLCTCKKTTLVVSLLNWPLVILQLAQNFTSVCKLLFSVLPWL